MVAPMLWLALMAAAMINVALALPTRSIDLSQAITVLSPAQIASYKPYTYFASAGYCNSTATLAWNCGKNCQARPGFKPVASGGDGDATQYWFVGFDSSLKSVIVSHQGTNPEEILPLLADAEFFFTSLSTSLFPGINSSVQVHSGFAKAQSKTAAPVLAAVKTTISRYGAMKVTLVGHSLGAAIALLDSVYLPLHLPSNITFQIVGYGLPRVGNQAFANYVDANVKSLTHINSREDFVPILPGKFLGYHHPSGEIHIEDSGEWSACPGQDNPDKRCIVGAVPDIFSGKEADHDGPYDGVIMGC